MSNPDWFRKTTWTAPDRADFFAHLQRSHKQNRAQYLKIQAYHLYESASPAAIQAALELTNLALTEYPQKIFLAELQEQKARCLNKLGDLQAAESAFQLAFDSMRAVPNVKPNTQFSFGLFVIEHKISRLYTAALQVLDEFTDHLEFPYSQYYHHGIRAVILNRAGSGVEARSSAIKALNAFTQEHSGFSHHPKAGLLNQPDRLIHAELQELVR